VRTGDRLVLCSDGLSNEVDPQEMAAILARPAPDRQAQPAEALVARANEHGAMTTSPWSWSTCWSAVAGRPPPSSPRCSVPRPAPRWSSPRGPALLRPPGPAPTTVTPATAVPPSGTPAPPSEPTDEITTMTPAVGGTAVAPTGVVRAVRRRPGGADSHRDHRRDRATRGVSGPSDTPG